MRRKTFRKMSRRPTESRDELIRRNRQMWQQMANIEVKPYEKIISYLNQSLINDPEKNREISIVRRAYDERHRRLVHSFNDQDDFETNQNELLIEAFQQENTFIQTKISSKEFSKDLGSALYEQISTDQLVYLQSLNED